MNAPEPSDTERDRKLEVPKRTPTKQDSGPLGAELPGHRGTPIIFRLATPYIDAADEDEAAVEFWDEDDAPEPRKPSGK